MDTRSVRIRLISGSQIVVLGRVYWLLEDTAIHVLLLCDTFCTFVSHLFITPNEFCVATRKQYTVDVRDSQDPARDLN